MISLNILKLVDVVPKFLKLDKIRQLILISLHLFTAFLIFFVHPTRSQLRLETPKVSRAPKPISVLPCTTDTPRASALDWTSRRLEMNLE